MKKKLAKCKKAKDNANNDCDINCAEEDLNSMNCERNSES